MTQALPQGFYPSQAYAPPYVDQPDAWLGVYVLTAGTVLLTGLLGFFAWSNSKDHEEIREEVDDVGKRLAHQQALAAQEQARVAAMDAHFQNQVNGLAQQVVYVDDFAHHLAEAAPRASRGRTVYEEPLFPRVSRAGTVLSQRYSAPMTQVAPSLPFAQTMPFAPAPSQPQSPVSVYVSTAPSSPSLPYAQTLPGAGASSAPSTPAHLERAITRAMSRRSAGA